MKIALFGGAFDPPHIGHKTVAESLIGEKIVDEVWFVPVFKHPWADKYGKQLLTDYDLRVRMLELTIGAQIETIAEPIKVAHFKDVSFTYDTLKYFSVKFPENEFSWVMGSEYLSRFDDFLKGHPKLTDYQFYIYPRAGYPFDDSLKKKNMIFLQGMLEVTASSTEIKQRIKNHQSIDTLVVPAVTDLINKNKLFL